MIGRKKLRLLLAAMIVATGIFLVPLKGYATGNCLLEFSQAQATAGNLVNVNIDVRGSVAAATLWITYDREKLQLVSTSGGLCVETEDGLILDAEHPTQGDLSFSICFKTLRAGQTEVSCTKYDIVDGSGEPLQCSGGVSTISVREGCHSGHQYQNGTCSICGDPYGAVLTGNVCYGGDEGEETTVTLWCDGEDVPLYTFPAGANYNLSSLTPGEYILQAERPNHVTRQYSVVVGDWDVVLNVELSPWGDVSNDREVDVMDLNMAYSHVCGTRSLSGYAAECGDVDGDGEISVLDLNRIYAHVSGSKPMF